MYPISFESEIPLEGRNRLTTFFRLLMVIPVGIVAAVYFFVAFFAAFIAWFAIAFTGKYPKGLYDFNAKALRLSTRANAYAFLATDQYPPFNGEEDANYPIRIGIAEPLDSYNRVKTIFRLIIGIPVILLNYLWSIILQVVGVVIWFAILFTGKFPEGLVGTVHNALSYYARSTAYYTLLMTEDYPPFSDESGSVAVGAIEPSTAPKAEVEK
jgi:hypothetical protein